MYCRGQAGFLTELQDQLSADHPELDVQILLVNRDHREEGMPDLTSITDLPVVQDDEQDVLVWERWGATWRDVFVLDRNNRVAGVYNLTEHDLQDDEEYVGMYELFVAAGATP